MICDKCNGKGFYENPHCCLVSNVVAWERGYTDPIKCRKCGGSGFLIGNANEVIEAIDFALNSRTNLSTRQLKQIRLVLNM